MRIISATTATLHVSVRLEQNAVTRSKAVSVGKVGLGTSVKLIETSAAPWTVCVHPNTRSVLTPSGRTGVTACRAIRILHQQIHVLVRICTYL